MMRVGFIGWRGMVGSVLMGRMNEEKDFSHIDPVFFTTSNVGGKGPNIGKDVPALKDARNINELKAMDDQSFPARVAITRPRSIPSFANLVGRATGSMLHLPFA